MRCCDEDSIFGEPGCLNARKGDDRGVAMEEGFEFMRGWEVGMIGEPRDDAVLLEG
jgi:hypothetical protein